MLPSLMATPSLAPLRTLQAAARNALTHLPGERPAWVVVELGGHLAPRPERPRFLGLPIPPPGFVHRPSLPELTTTLDALARAPWLTGVLFRMEAFQADPATAFALRRAVVALRASGKRTVAYLTQLDWTGYYVASAAHEIVAPECADIELRGLGLSMTFMRDALAKAGIRFEKLAIDEYKNAFDNLVRQEMSPHHREQLEVLLERFEAHYTEAIGEGRGLAPAAVRALVDEGLTSAQRALDAKLVDRLAYEDEIVGPTHKALGEAARFLTTRVPPMRGGRVAVVSLTGNILTGKSRRLPAPIGGKTAGSETLVRALRRALEDKSTRAVVLFVDSGGGSALASDLIGREVRRVREHKPVVAVMGAVAASGGYYVLTHASRVVAAPTTITGSIGVITGKLVVDELFARWGLNAQQVRRGRYALLLDPATPLSDDERALLQRHNQEVYDRFVSRVADGRHLSVERVREIARGRIWSGSDALTHGLVDELGDLSTGIQRAKELGGLGPNAPVWDVEAPDEHLLPTPADAASVMAVVRPMLRETSWAILPAWLRIG
jgi:protease-4